MEENNNFDFSKPLDLSEFEANLEERLHKQVQEKLKSTEKYPKSGNKNQYVLIVVFILLTGLIVAGAFSVNQTLRIQELESKLANTAQVAGVSESNIVENIIAGNGFSIVAKEKTPTDFVLKTDFGKVSILDTNGSITSFLVKKEKGGIEIKSGLEVSVVEYDNKLKDSTFLSKVQDYLGSNYTLASEKIKVSGQFEMYKLVPRSKDDPIYYLSLTDNNYYLIKFYNQTAQYPEFITHTRFTDQLIPNLWLN